MDFVTAEEKFQELQARIRRGEPMSEDQYQEELAKLMVQDESGVFWSLEPGTGRWLYFNGTEWVPGSPPKQPSAPPVVPPPATAETPPVSEPSAYEPYSTTTPATSEAPSYYVPSDVTRPMEYTGSYTDTSYPPTGETQAPSFATPSADAPGLDSEGMPTYMRMPEPDAAPPTGGIPPRPVREASPLAVPGGERAWLPFAFGALVLLLCAVVLFFGVRGLPQFNPGAASAVPTEEPTEEPAQVLPTETVEFLPTRVEEPTQQPTEAPQPTAAPQVVTATTTDVLNIRQGPARTTPSLGKLKQGEQVTVVGRNGDGTWLQVERPDGAGTGWVSAEFVTVSGDVNTLPVTSGENAAPAATETPTG